MNPKFKIGDLVYFRDPNWTNASKRYKVPPKTIIGVVADIQKDISLRSKDSVSPFFYDVDWFNLHLLNGYGMYVYCYEHELEVVYETKI